MDLQDRFRHWPEAHGVVGDILRRTLKSFRGSGMVSQDMLDVVLDLLRHFFFLESTGQLPRRGPREYRGRRLRRFSRRRSLVRNWRRLNLPRPRRRLTSARSPSCAQKCSSPPVYLATSVNAFPSSTRRRSSCAFRRTSASRMRCSKPSSLVLLLLLPRRRCVRR